LEIKLQQQEELVRVLVRLIVTFSINQLLLTSIMAFQT